jgi:hypothetical protein
MAPPQQKATQRYKCWCETIGRMCWVIRGMFGRFLCHLPATSPSPHGSILALLHWKWNAYAQWIFRCEVTVYMTLLSLSSVATYLCAAEPPSVITPDLEK